MRVINEHLEIFELKEIHSSRGSCRRGDKSLQCRANVLNVEAPQVTRKHSRKDVGDIEYRLASERKRNVCDLIHANFPFPLHDGDITIFSNGRNSSALRMAANARIVFIEREQGDLAAGIILHFIYEIIIRIKNGIAVGP